MSMTVQVKDIYAQVLEPLEKSADEAFRRLAIERASQEIADLQNKVGQWERAYDSSYDLFAYRTSTDEEYVAALDADPATSQWEGDLIAGNFTRRSLTNGSNACRVF